MEVEHTHLVLSRRKGESITFGDNNHAIGHVKVIYIGATRACFSVETLEHPEPRIFTLGELEIYKINDAIHFCLVEIGLGMQIPKPYRVKIMIVAPPHIVHVRDELIPGTPEYTKKLMDRPTYPTELR